MAYVYRHIRLDKNEPFYIGIGSDKKYNRAFVTYDRNPIWNKIYKKTEIVVEILLTNLTYKDACEKEIEFIKLYGRLDNGTGTLSNLTDGGEGTLGILCTEDKRKKLKEASTGIVLSKETKEKMSKARKGQKAWNKNIKNSSGVSSSKIVIDLQTGIYYASTTEAANVIGMKRPTLSKMLTNVNPNKTNFIFA